MTPAASSKETKDSGVPWIGDMPSDWSLRRYKHIFKERDERSKDGSETLLSVSAYTGVSPRAGNVEDGELEHRAASLEGYKICRKGDLVMNIMLAWNRAQGITKFDGIVSPAYSVFSVIDDSNKRFLDYLVRCDTTTKYFKAWSYGIIESRLRLYPETFGSLYCAMPNKSDQSAIADYLDHATSRVDTLVAKKTRFIELLREKRQALITHAVTKGLDRGAAMKDSGAEWLGEVPETWDIAPLKSFLQLRRDIVGTDSVNTKLLSLTLQGVIERDLENPTGKMPASFDGYQRISAGEMVFCLFDMDETPRTVGVALQDGMLTGAYSVFRPQSELWARYLYYFFLHVDEYKRLKPFYKGLRKTIRPGPFLSIQVPRPKDVDAKAIVEHLDRSTSRIDTLIAKTERSIELLREHRTALITAAVTGKIDLRSANA